MMTVVTRARINCPCERCVDLRGRGLFIDEGDGWALYSEFAEVLTMVRTERERERRARAERREREARQVAARRAAERAARRARKKGRR